MIKDKQIQMVAHAYQPKGGSQNYLHIQVPAGRQSIGDRHGFTLNPRTPQNNVDFTYLVSRQYSNKATAMQNITKRLRKYYY